MRAQRSAACIAAIASAALVHPAAGDDLRVFMARDGEQHAVAHIGHTTLVMESGTRATVMVWFYWDPDSALFPNAYQLVLPMTASAGLTGTVRYVDNEPFGGEGDSLVIDTQRADWLFAIDLLLSPVYRESAKQGIIAVFYATVPGICVMPCRPAGIYYLAEFEIEASDDACGLFELAFRRPPDVPATAFFNQFGGQHAIDEYQPLTVDVTGKHCPCPEGSVEWRDPPTGVVDARQPHPAHDSATAQGIAALRVAAPPGAGTVGCWSLCEPDSLTPNRVAFVSDEGDGTYLLHLERALTPGAVTAVTYGGLRTAYFTAHPTDVDADGLASPADLLALIDHINGVAQPPWGPYSSDIDLSGQAGPQDILATIDLWNGAGQHEPWLGTSVLANPQCP
jgi:hypothetical protein